MSTTRTIHLTADETAKIDTLPRFGGEEQDAMLDLRKRSGVRYGLAVKQGRFNIVTIAYGLNRKGEPTGSSTVEVVRGNLLANEVIPAIRSL